MHYHGADGVYAGVTAEGLLKLYCGEFKIYKDVTSAIQDCLASLAPFLVEPEHEGAERERDLILLSDKADLSDPNLTEALKRYFDKNSVKSKRVQYCGIALVGFDAPFYPGGEAKAVADEIAEAARTELESGGRGSAIASSPRSSSSSRSNSSACPCRPRRLSLGVPDRDGAQGMSLIDLQTWLLGEGIRDALDDLTKRMVVTEIDNLVPPADAAPTPEIDWSRLLLAGSILARSDQRPLQEAALRIATGAVTLSTSEAVKDAGTVL